MIYVTVVTLYSCFNFKFEAKLEIKEGQYCRKFKIHIYIIDVEGYNSSLYHACTDVLGAMCSNPKPLILLTSKGNALPIFSRSITYHLV